ncbi:MAG: fructose-6-phosphate aldolase [Bacillota bacterium]|nr:fructose-6-phosphate aldolase [Bacillota bacterium]
MDLYLDTANIEEIKEVAAWGVLAGLTTNPSLLAKEGVAIKDFMAEAEKYVKGPLSLEVLSDTAPEMVAEAKELKSYGDNVVIKLPLTEEGLKAQSRLAPMGFDTNMTLVFSANQALLAAKAGATYVSPFVGRVDDIGAEGKALVGEIKSIFKQYGLATKIIAASIRTARDVTDAALAGADIATIPHGIIKKMVKHPLTDAGLERFKADWERSFACK